MKEMGWDEEKLKVNGVDEDAFVEMASTYQKYALSIHYSTPRHPYTVDLVRTF
jgi:hypothetical protein